MTESKCLNPYIVSVSIIFAFCLLIPIISSNYDVSAQIPFVLGTYAFIALISGFL